MIDDPQLIERNRRRLATRTLEQEAELVRIEREALARFSGSFDELETALGMLRMGHHVGWRVLVLVHNKRTIRKFEEALQINIREFFAMEGPSCDRSLGYILAKRAGNFWKAVSGAIKIERRREIGDGASEEA